MSVKVIYFERERWMYTVKSKDGKIEGQVFASVVGSPGVMIVSVKPNGKGMHYCSNCQAFFSRQLIKCPECKTDEIQPAINLREAQI